MLVLTRRKDEEIIVSKNITIKVLSVKGNKVRLGIKAPENMEIKRPETLDTQSNQNCH